MKNFLITGFYFEGYHGSMMHICEIAKYLKSKNFNVFIASVEISTEIREFVEQIGVKLYQVKDLPLDIMYDYVLAYHYPILSYLLKNSLKYDKLMCGSLSSIENLEVPHCACRYGVPLQVHSGNLKQQVINKYNIDESLIHVMPNLVPEEYLDFKIHNNDILRKIAIISNHCPKELRKIVKLFALQGVKVDIFGMKDTYVPVTPKLLSGYDVVVTIGKTVQYALSMGIPVYNYDHFGGAGYITLENMDNEEYYNYSGRSNFRKLSADDIVCEICAYYKPVLSQMPEIKKIAQERYSIKVLIDNLILYMDKQSHINLEKSFEDEVLYYNACEFCIDRVSGLTRVQKQFLTYKELLIYCLKYILYAKIFKNKQKAKKYLARLS